MEKEKKLNALIEVLPDEERAKLLEQLVNNAADPRISSADFTDRLDKLSELSRSLDK